MAFQKVAESPKDVPALNLDVFQIILQSCTVADLLQVGYVSHILRKEAVKELLSRPVHLSGNIQIDSFCQLMLTGDPSRFAYLHTVVINHTTHITPDAVGMLAQVISRATQLRRLYLRWCDAAFTKHDTRFADAVSQLEHLRLLQVWGGREVHELIRLMVLRLRSALKTLDLPHEDDNQLGVHFPNEVAEHQPRLEKLHIGYRTLSLTWTPYPSLRILSLCIGDQNIDLRCISQIFPNLREFSLTAHIFEVDVVRPSDQIAATRNASIALHRDGGGWKSLDYLHGTIGDLYALCLTCPVRRVDLGQYDYTSHHAYLDVISRTRPRRVDIMVYCAPWFQTVILASPSLFVYDTESTEPGSVSHVCLLVSVPAEEVVTTRALINTISPFLGTCQLEYLHVKIGEIHIRDESDYLLEPPPVHPKLQETMAKIDIAVLVSALATSGSSLRTIVLSPASRERTVWTVDRGDGRQVLRRLDPYTASQVVEREEQ
ncbi:hypothetical protein K466DRAFT_568571 [Polyporus arcularius HHB13444]|uniref:F-box domain-containing protein n=1 Tax=Polyporus arcularius HHB13444 TaxID=1314778 RepID=A0A5C3NY89_9APHY|nr:hypothetical protein K466DRAFT_568571 [Polyporus arcularius HHB13444]